MKKYFKEQKILLSFIVFFTILFSLFCSFVPLLFNLFIDKVTNTEFYRNVLNIVLSGIVLFIYLILLFLLDYVRRRLRTKFIFKIDFALKTDYLEYVFKNKLSDTCLKESGFYLSKISNDIPAIIQDYVFEIFNLILYFFQSLFSIIVSFIINWKISLIFIVISGIIIVYTFLFEKKFSKIKKNISKANETYTTDFEYIFNGLLEIKSNNAEQRFVDKAGKSITRLNTESKRWWKIEAFYSPGTSFLTDLLTFSSIFMCTIFYFKNEINIGTLVSVTYLSTMIFNPFSNFFENLTYIKANKSLFSNLFDKKFNLSTPQNNNCTNSISLENVSVHINDKLILENLNLKISANEKCLLIGESGSGKTTFIKALCKCLSYKGIIKLGNIDYDQIQDDDFFKYVSYCQQTPYIFNDSLLNNIDLAGTHKFDAGKKLDEFRLSNLKNRLSEEVNNQTQTISGGEKQRISLLRSLLKNPIVLCLDEVTSSLDKENTDIINNIICSLKNTTVIYSCHKVTDTLLKSFDSVICFNKKTAIKESVTEYENRICNTLFLKN